MEQANMTGKTSLITLNNGIKMPALGLGVFRSSPEQTAKAVATAIAHGSQLIDTAAAYLNERQVGEGIVRSGIDRPETRRSGSRGLNASMSRVKVENQASVGPATDARSEELAHERFF
jgi:predicted aldo/keto reductase-like oxidoreductase